MVRIVHDARVGGFIPDGLDNIHAANQDAPLSEGEETDSNSHPFFPFPESDAVENWNPCSTVEVDNVRPDHQRCRSTGNCRVSSNLHPR